jgi:hypothetical protein
MTTPTPRTDAAWAASFSPETPGFNMRDLANTLERELAAERAKVIALKEAGLFLIHHAEEATPRLKCDRHGFDSAIAWMRRELDGYGMPKEGTA